MCRFLRIFQIHLKYLLKANSLVSINSWTIAMLSRSLIFIFSRGDVLYFRIKYNKHDCFLLGSVYTVRHCKCSVNAAMTLAIQVCLIESYGVAPKCSCDSIIFKETSIAGSVIAALKVHSHSAFFSDCDCVFKMGYMAVNGGVHTAVFLRCEHFHWLPCNAILKHSHKTHSVNEP